MGQETEMKKVHGASDQCGEGSILSERRAGHQEMQDDLQHTETIAALRQGLAEAERNEVLSLRKAEARLRSKHGFSRGEAHGSGKSR